MKRKEQKMKQYLIGICSLILLIAIAIIGGNRVVLPIGEIKNTTTSNIQGENLLSIYYFDVGQSDSILIQNNGVNMMIDTGDKTHASVVVQNLQKLGIKKVDYLVGTHPHEDHIGGMKEVIQNFEIGKVYMPKVQTNTKVFENTLDAIETKGLSITAPKVGDIFLIGEATCEVMNIGSGSEEEQKNLNLSSLVIRMTWKEQSYLFMGDAEVENEKAREWPQTNVVKIGHHGSNTSTSTKFLEQTNPEIAVISVGKNNSYGHPNKEVIDRLEKRNISMYRTDENGMLLIVSNGKENEIRTKVEL